LHEHKRYLCLIARGPVDGGGFTASVTTVNRGSQ